jgi:protein-S-isoprenylcysteine O-methyltransferase Ste14
MNGLVYLFHGIFWSAFIVRAFRPRAAEETGKPESSGDATRKARHPGLLLFFHGVGFGAMYAAIGPTVFAPEPQPRLFQVPWPVGAAVILLGAAVFAWALWVFGSWRVLAKLDSSHQLCIDGPYRLVRHPIYLACDLLAIGTFLWIPTAEMLVALLLMLLGAELRARAEEKLLLGVFGDAYRRYCGATKRFVPGVY